MILNQITLRNFCLYRGEQVFNLSPELRAGKAAPIVLFGGINGGGKTTLLDAVQLVLYGIRARCSKRGEKSYEDFLRESIHHGADPSEGTAIQLLFRYVSDGQEQLYEVTRSWSEIRGRVRETVEVHRNGELDSWLSGNWSQLVEELIPFGIAQLCFFDAEKIRFLAEDETSTEALGNAIKSLLGLDLVERLVMDAGVLESRMAKRSRKSTDLQEVEKLEADLSAKQIQIERLVQERGSLENPRLAAHERVLNAEERFAKIGGIHWQQRESRQRKLTEVETALKDNEQRLVEVSATEAPLALVANLLRQAAKQTEGELRATEAGVVSKLLCSRDAELLKLITRKKLDGAAFAIIDKFLTKDRSERAAQSEVVLRLQLSDIDRRLLGHLLDRGLADKCRSAKELLERVESDRRNLEDLHRGLAAMPDEDAVRMVSDQLKVASKESASLDQQVGRIDKELDTLRNERTGLENQLAKLHRKVVDEEIRNEEDARMANLLVRTQNTMKDFLTQATSRKIDRLSALITESFRFLLRKKTLVHRVLIHPESFAITVFDQTGRQVPKYRLSEGEKQIFAISVLWGLSRAAGRPLPTIIDTPMARLDSEHRNQLVERYFPNASHQVIILSTDTEIDVQYFHDLQPNIARAYHLKYNDDLKTTTAEEGYFWDSKSAVELVETSP